MTAVTYLFPVGPGPPSLHRDVQAHGGALPNSTMLSMMLSIVSVGMTDRQDPGPHSLLAYS